MSGRVRERQSGYTLIELLLGMLLAGILATAVYAFFVAGLEASSGRDSQSRAQNNARLAIEVFTRDVRQAVSPDGIVAPVASAPTSTRVELWVDTNRTAGAITPIPKRVRYMLSGNRLVRQVLTAGVWSPESVLAEPVANGSTPLFSAMDTGGDATTVPGAIATISLRLILADRSGRAATNTELIADATLRNRI